MKNSGKGPSKSQSRRLSKEENGDGWVTFGGEQKATLPEQHWSGTAKDNTGEVAPITPGREGRGGGGYVGLRLTWEKPRGKRRTVTDGGVFWKHYVD